MKTSLTFVIDVTGSMSNDIKEAKRATKKIVIEAKDSQFVPENYVLVTFSDPGVYQTLDLLLSLFHNRPSVLSNLRVPHVLSALAAVVERRARKLY